MGMGSFLAGLFLGSLRSSTPVYEYNATIISNPIQYPDDWHDYTVKKKLEWLKNRSYWHEYYELKYSLNSRIDSKLVEGDNIYSKVIDSIIRNKSDTTEANQLFTEYLNKGYMSKVINNTTRAMLAMEIDRMNDCIQHNYSSISQFGKPVEYIIVLIQDLNDFRHKLSADCKKSLQSNSHAFGAMFFFYVR